MIGLSAISFHRKFYPKTQPNKNVHFIRLWAGTKIQNSFLKAKILEESKYSLNRQEIVF